MQQGDQTFATYEYITNYDHCYNKLCCVETLRVFVRTLRGAEKMTVMKLNRPAVIYNKTLFRFSTDNNNVCYKGFFIIIILIYIT